MRILFLALGLAASGCSKATPTTAPNKPAAVAKPVLTIYSGRSALLVEPLLQKFAEANGIEVKTRFDKSSEALANRLAMEGVKSDADLFFAQTVGYLSLLGEQGLLRKLSDPLLRRVAPDKRSDKGLWVATSGRLRVMVYSPERVKNLPKTLFELADARFAGRVGWAPGNASFQAHVSALRSHWGEAKTTTWLKAMQANKPAVYPKNSPQVRAVDMGEIDIGLVNHYYLHKLRAQNPGLKAANAHFVLPGDAGNLVMLAGVGIPKSSKHPQLAEQLIEFLLSDEGQSYFAQKAYEYPSVQGVPLHKDVRPVEGIVLKMPQAALTDLAASLALLRRLRLQ
ncbi:MAG: extracellular solute-binding protein [Myxococcota bacterium]|nr:extracellular solute-binding protein [Myxococcota bacterium]